MQLLPLVIALLVLTSIGYYLGRGRALTMAGGSSRNLHSLPGYYGFYVALWCGIPAFLVLAAWLAFEPTLVRALVMNSLPPSAQALPEGELRLLMNEVRQFAGGRSYGREPSEIVIAAAEYYTSLKTTGFAALIVFSLSLAVAGLAWGRKRIHQQLRARVSVERAVKVFLIISSTIAVFTTIGIVMSLLFESIRFFQAVPPMEFLFGLNWSPQTAIRADQVGSSGAFGAVPLFAGTLLISLIAMTVAVPVGLFSAIYMAEYAPSRVRAVVKPLLEVLAGIPTVVYGFFAALTVAPFLRDSGSVLGLSVASESALAAGLVMGIMIIPFISSLSDDVITSVPHSLRQGSYGLGATKSETIRQVVIPAALPGIVGGVLLAASRAIGETMIVVMAAGLAANLTANPFEAVTTVTVQIVTLLVGDQEFDSPKTLAAFALGLVLFCVTLVLNVVALHVVRKYREKYD
ncbi:phosphate ABC transporter permease subunit PstC [Telmatospirillum sp. J64-1]|uniref:phosphate ABC transporter permease subunit PstC n=1 Tax=Telmatospirillum sp. J64-1 TaxID=2502183 RepID=UPI00115CB918|nr:phosphate ABC transporter permease subunit PstC [Telmatospirillum sp. J64-1]